MAEFGKPGSRLSVPFPPEVSTQVGAPGSRHRGLASQPSAPGGWRRLAAARCCALLPAGCPRPCCPWQLPPHPRAPPSPATVQQLLAVLRGALALGNPRLAEPALSCMHKLVAYAYMQGETGPSGRLDDDSNLVTQVGGCWRWHCVGAGIAA